LSAECTAWVAVWENRTLPGQLSRPLDESSEAFSFLSSAPELFIPASLFIEIAAEYVKCTPRSSISSLLGLLCSDALCFQKSHERYDPTPPLQGEGQGGDGLIIKNVGLLEQTANLRHVIASDRREHSNLKLRLTPLFPRIFHAHLLVLRNVNRIKRLNKNLCNFLFLIQFIL
jgi:hypothetical protein